MTVETRVAVRCLTDVVHWQLLDSLPADERERLLASTRSRSFAKGEVVVREGDASDSLHLVDSGRLAVRVDTPAGDTAIFSVIGPGDWFGELSLLGEGAPVRTATVVALEAATTLSLTAAAFDDLRRRHSSMDRLLLSLMSERIHELSGRLVEVMYDGLDRRVVRRLVDLAGTYADDSPGVTIPLTQEQLAGLVGGTRSSVNEVLQTLATEGLIELGRGHIDVVDPAALARRSESASRRRPGQPRS